MSSNSARDPAPVDQPPVRHLGSDSSTLLSGHRRGVYDTAWSPTADLFATGSSDESTRIWDGSTCRLVSVLPDAGPVYSIAWSPDGTLIAVSGQGARLTIYRVATSQAVAAFHAPYLLLRGATWTRDGKRVATATGPDQVVILSASSAAILSVLPYHADDVAFSPVAEWLAVANDGVFLLDRDFDRVQLSTASASSIAWAPGGDRLAAITSSGAYVWSVPDGALVAFIPEASGGRPAWSRDGSRLAVPAGTDIVVSDVATGSPLAVLKGHSDAVCGLTWDPTGTGIVSGSADGSVRLWDLTSTGSNDAVSTEEVHQVAAAVRVFYSYAHEDARFRKELEVRLSLLRREGLIDDWSDRKIEPGGTWASEIGENLETAAIVLLLVSPDFLASDYCYDVEVNRALARHDEGATKVIPIVLKPVDWHSAPFGRLQALPEDGKPITRWRNRDEAWLNVVQGLRRVIERTRAE